MAGDPGGHGGAGDEVVGDGCASASLLRMVRRAVENRHEPPRGPVYFAFRWTCWTPEGAIPSSRPYPSMRVIPQPKLVDQAAGMLASAQTPMIYVGDGVAAPRRQNEALPAGRDTRRGSVGADV